MLGATSGSSRRLDRRIDCTFQGYAPSPENSGKSDASGRLRSGGFSGILRGGSARGGMADAPDLGSGPARVGGSSPLVRTSRFREIGEFVNFPDDSRTEEGRSRLDFVQYRAAIRTPWETDPQHGWPCRPAGRGTVVVAAPERTLPGKSARQRTAGHPGGLDERGNGDIITNMQVLQLLSMYECGC
jgi:hypothetical protein